MILEQNISYLHYEVVLPIVCDIVILLKLVYSRKVIFRLASSSDYSIITKSDTDTVLLYKVKLLVVCDIGNWNFEGIFSLLLSTLWRLLITIRLE